MTRVMGRVSREMGRVPTTPLGPAAAPGPTTHRSSAGRARGGPAGSGGAGRDVADRDSVDRAIAERDSAQRDIADRDIADRDVGDRDVGDRDIGDRDIGDRGAASVLVLTVAVALVTLAAALGLLVQGAVGRARAQSAADLTALAAARAAQRAAFEVPGARDPCAVAADVAVHGGGRLVSCDEGAGAVVRVDVAVDRGPVAFRATARAGPRPP